MKYFRIKNYSKYQHFKNRGSAPWIKVYRAILRDYEFCQLTDIQKGHWLMILLLASEHIEEDRSQPYEDPKTGDTRYRHTHKALPLDPTHIRDAIGSRSPVNLKIFLDKGFIEEIDIKLISRKDEIVSPEVDYSETDSTEEQKDRNGERGIPFEDLSLARTMREEIFKICPDTAGPEVEQSWATEIQKMRRVKKLTTEQIVQTWDWARNDEFYCKIVSGPAELFRHWDKIRFKMVQKPKQSENRYEKARNQSAGFAERYKNGELRIGQNQLHGFGGEIPQRTGDS